jgi:hypothetical protein
MPWVGWPPRRLRDRAHCSTVRAMRHRRVMNRLRLLRTSAGVYPITSRRPKTRSNASPSP